MDETYRDPLGNEYYVLSGQQMNIMFSGISNFQEFAPDEKIYIPKTPSNDDYLDFPSKQDFVNHGLFFQSGIAHHKLEFFSLQSVDRRGLTARDIEVFGEDWDGECYHVLEAHGWHQKSFFKDNLIKTVVGKFGACEVTKAKLEFGENWSCRIRELAATELIQPFSRLWYVVNMEALHYLYHDDLRLGYLWSEYKQRLKSELAFHRGQKTVKSASEGGRTRAAESYEARQRILALIKKYCESGHSASRAAELVARAGIGTSKAGNYQIWKRYGKR